MELFKTANFSPRINIYYGESASDLALMPTTTKVGQGKYPKALASSGSYAIILETTGAKKYMLRSTGWVELQNEGGGTADYNELINKPTINGATIQGDLTSDDIEVASKPRLSGTTLIL